LIIEGAMFTGIVEEAGQVAEVQETPQGTRLSVNAEVVRGGTKIGDSIAVNGCCLTVVSLGETLGFDLLRETWQRTNLHAVEAGSLVNLERSMAADGRIHGHFVTGHIDGTGRIQVFEERGADWYLRVEAPQEILRYVVFKGAIAVDGVSLTVAEVDVNSFGLWIIPHTYSVTALRERRSGSLVNLEADLLAKYVQKQAAT
jgi:riboflavin synthase